MKSTERHDLRRNELLELLSNPRELARKHALTALIIVVALALAIWLIVRASGAQERKWRQAWSPLAIAMATQNEEQLKALVGQPKTKPLVRAWAKIKRADLLYKRTQQNQYFKQTAAREELLNQAISCHQQAIQIGQEWREVLGQATIGLGLCYENLGQFERASQQYEAIISQAEGRFAGTVWLLQAQTRKALLERLADEKIVFSP